MIASLISLFLGIRKLLSGAVSALWGIVGRYPLPFALIASLVLAGWLYRGEIRARHALAVEQQGRRADRAAYIAAQVQAQALALAQKSAVEAHYKEIADAQETQFRASLDSARLAADRYIQSHRVFYAAPKGPAGSTATPAKDRGPGIPQALPPGSVVVSEANVQACTSASTYALRAYEWAGELGK